MKRASLWTQRRDGSYQRLDATAPSRSARRDRRRILAHVVVLGKGEGVRIAWATLGASGDALSIAEAQFTADEALRRAGWTLEDASEGAPAGGGS